MLHCCVSDELCIRCAESINTEQSRLEKKMGVFKLTNWARPIVTIPMSFTEELDVILIQKSTKNCIIYPTSLNAAFSFLHGPSLRWPILSYFWSCQQDFLGERVHEL